MELEYQVNDLNGRGTLWQAIFATLTISIGMYYLSSYNYLLYHSMVELFAAVVAFTIFSIGWHTRKYSQTNILILLAVGYLLVGITDVLHTLAFKGMGVFTGYDANLPTQLWIAGRYLEALTILSGAYYLGRKKLLHAPYLLALALIFATSMIIAIFTGYFPDCFVEGQGLTVFKIASEYIISLLLLLAAVIFYRKRNHLPPYILKLLLAAISLTVLSEMSFTLYVDVYGFFNYLGHIFKLFSVMLIYKALIEESLNNPFQLLFKELSESKNQLQADLEKITAAEVALRESEALTRMVMDNLPIGIAVNSVEPGVIFTYMNDNFPHIYRTTRKALSDPDVFWEVVYEDPNFRADLKERVLADIASGEPEKMKWDNVPISRNGEIVSYISAQATPLPEKNLLISTVWDVTEQILAEESVNRLNEELEQRVLDRTSELEASNKELESFAYSIAHDFRAPLRAINGFSTELVKQYYDQIDDRGKHYLNRIIKASTRMGELIDDFLQLSRVTRVMLKYDQINLSDMAEKVSEKLMTLDPDRTVSWKIAENIVVRGDRELLWLLIEKLLHNAWKFTGKQTFPAIEVGRTVIEGEEVFYIRDNGVGFDMAYVDKLFGVFQRLHGAEEFPGTGVGLAAAQRVINRHGGKIWAEGEVGKGATFYFTLGRGSSGK